MIPRTQYLDRIRPFYDSELIKVITGVRRCGKSVLLRQIADEIGERQLDPAEPDALVFVDFDDYANRQLADPDELYRYIKPKLSAERKTYLLFDEIQNVRDFELVVNSFNTTDNVSIFLTGSNSKLLSGELATRLGGRTVSFHVMPFNFREFCRFKGDQFRSGSFEKQLSEGELLGEYLTWGGFPLVCGQEMDEPRRVVLDNLYSSIVLRDIIQRNGISSATTLENVLDYLIANSSLTISGNNIAAELTDSVRKVSAPTVYDLIRFIEEAYVVGRAERYDIRGKKKLRFEAKEYVCDLGLFRLRKNRVKDEWSCVVETAVYNELVSRGMQVYVGKLHKSEIDFVVQSNGLRCYVQAAYLMADDATVEREFGALEAIGDSYPKYVISMDPMVANRNGITHLKLIDFLSDESLLRLG